MRDRTVFFITLLIDTVVAVTTFFGMVLGLLRLLARQIEEAEGFAGLGYVITAGALGLLLMPVAVTLANVAVYRWLARHNVAAQVRHPRKILLGASGASIFLSLAVLYLFVRFAAAI